MHQFGTDSQVQFVPLNTTIRRIGADEVEPTEYLGTSPQVARHIAPQAFAATGGLLAMAIIAADGQTQLQVAPRTGAGTWGNPVTIATTAGGIVALDIESFTANGSTMAVWTEIDANNSNNAFPPSKIMFAMSTDGGNTWGASSIAAEFDYVADDLHLMGNSEITALVYQCANMGADSNERAINGLLYTGSWSTATQLVAPMPLLDLDASAGATGNIAVAYAAEGGTIGAFRWGGGVAPAVTEIDTNGGGAVDVNAIDSENADVFWGDSEGIRTWRLALVQDPQLLFPGVHPDSIDVAKINQTSVVTWSDGGALYYGNLDADNAPDGGAMPLTRNLFGAYDNVSVLADATIAPGTASILASFGNGNQTELRAFHVSPTEGLVLADQDGDGLLDIDELHIIDADTADNINVIADVTPAGDFDGDGKTNLEELMENTDPTDPGSFTGDGNPGDKPSDVWLAANAPGVGWLEDRDGDGLVTLAEFFLDGDPDRPDAGDRLIPGTSLDGRPTLTYIFRNDANVTVTPQVSSDGQTWTNAGIQQLSSSDNGDGTSTVTVAGPEPLGDSVTLMRLALRLQ